MRLTTGRELGTLLKAETGRRMDAAVAFIDPDRHGQAM
jgi:hypothetical protein